MRLDFSLTLEDSERRFDVQGEFSKDSRNELFGYHYYKNSQRTESIDSGNKQQVQRKYQTVLHAVNWNQVAQFRGPLDESRRNESAGKRNLMKKKFQQRSVFPMLPSFAINYDCFGLANGLLLIILILWCRCISLCLFPFREYRLLSRILMGVFYEILSVIKIFVIWNSK